MPRTKVSKIEGGGYRVTIRPNNADEQPMVTRKFWSKKECKEGIPDVRREWREARDARRTKRA